MTYFRPPIPPFRRRFLRRQRQLPPASRKTLKWLQHTHKLMASGEFSNAAVIFEELADAASARDIPQAPQLHLQAGRAWIEADEVERGIERLQTGLQEMSTLGLWRHLPTTCQRILHELRTRGLTQQAAALEIEIERLLALHGQSLAASPLHPGKARLPTKCPSCGGSFLPDEVDWVDNSFATCSYCGSLLEAES